MSVLLCLLDWVMVIPVSKLLAKKCDDNITMLSRVFKVSFKRFAPKFKKYILQPS